MNSWQCCSFVVVVASGVFFSVHRNPYSETKSRSLRLLAKTVYRDKDRIVGYSLMGQKKTPAAAGV
jgi:hypothetical protein